MSRARQLYRLQTIELGIEGAKRRLKEVKASLEEGEQLRRAYRAVEEIEAAWRRCQANLRDLELETRGLAEKIEATRGKLYGGRVGNPKELAALEEKLGYLERRKERREDETLEAMVALEENEGELAERREELTRLETECRRDRERLVAEREELEAKLDHLKGERIELRQVIAADDLALYDDLRRRKGGQAVALLDGSVCRCCGVTLPSGKAQQAWRGEDLSFCDGCGRILYAE